MNPKLKLTLVVLLILFLCAGSYIMGFIDGRFSMEEFCAWSKTIEVSLEGGGLLK